MAGGRDMQRACPALTRASRLPSYQTLRSRTDQALRCAGQTKRERFVVVRGKRHEDDVRALALPWAFRQVEALVPLVTRRGEEADYLAIDRKSTRLNSS